MNFLFHVCLACEENVSGACARQKWWCPSLGT